MKSKSKAASRPKPRNPTKPGPAKGLVDSVERIKAWMTAHGAGILVTNLKKGASAAAIAKAEKQLGFAIPAELKQLWKLHDGQKAELNGFIGSKDLLSVAEAVRVRTSLLMATQRVIEHEEGGEMTPSERDDLWLPFAARDRDMLAVHATSGRVFLYWEDFTLSSKTVTAWFESYANGIERGNYAVEEGFGDVYLSES
ncbi:MAG: SMI1/KNR4 family protein [Kofleriaceae bacterium]